MKNCFSLRHLIYKMLKEDIKDGGCCWRMLCMWFLLIFQIVVGLCFFF